MAYTDFNKDTPDPTTQTPGAAFTSDRSNLLAMRDAIIGGVGFFPGWNISLQNSNGSGYPDDPTQPPQVFYTKGGERLRVVMTWSGGRVIRLVFYHRPTAQSNEDIIKGGSNNGYFDLTYDNNGLFLSGAWS